MGNKKTYEQFRSYRWFGVDDLRAFGHRSRAMQMGYDPVEEVEAYGQCISDIHIKDRLLGGGSVELGAGDSSFDRFFNALNRLNYAGPFIMQAYRDDGGVDVFRRQLTWVREKYLDGIWT